MGETTLALVRQLLHTFRVQKIIRALTSVPTGCFHDLQHLGDGSSRLGWTEAGERQ